MQKQISITFMSGPKDGDVLIFDVPENIYLEPLILSIGRREDLDICLDFDNQVSRLHANLGFDGSEFWLEDVDSRNGTFLHDERLSANEKNQIEAGTLFKVGRTWLRLDPLPSDMTAPADTISPDSNYE